MAAKDDKQADVQTVAAPEHHLTVIHPFGDYKRGDMIKDPYQIAAIHAGENKHHVHKITPQS